ncbi:MAG: sel1 repeat family protein [Holosporales bacterium]|nr:sel1 repeat family protein [Holosporales bacterium]
MNLDNILYKDKGKRIIGFMYRSIIKIPAIVLLAGCVWQFDAHGGQDVAEMLYGLEDPADGPWISRQIQFAYNLFAGNGVPRDVVRGAHVLREAVDAMKRVRSIKTAADAGNPDAQFQYFIILRGVLDKASVYTRDDELFADILNETACYCIRAANNGNLDAQLICASKFFASRWYRDWIVKGKRWTEDDTVRIGAEDFQFREVMLAHYWKLAADQGHPGAQYEVARILAEGALVPEDKAGAAYYCKKAADQGNPEAQIMYGTMRARGDGVPMDEAEAERYYRLAAAQGNPEAQSQLDYLLQRRERRPA